MWQVESGMITWVCTNSPPALGASVTAKAVRARQISWKNPLHHTKKSKPNWILVFPISLATTEHNINILQFKILFTWLLLLYMERVATNVLELTYFLNARWPCILDLSSTCSIGHILKSEHLTANIKSKLFVIIIPAIAYIANYTAFGNKTTSKQTCYNSQLSRIYRSSGKVCSVHLVIELCSYT